MSIDINGNKIIIFHFKKDPHYFSIVSSFWKKKVSSEGEKVTFLDKLRCNFKSFFPKLENMLYEQKKNDKNF